MMGYYLDLAIRSLRRNVVLTALMIVAIGIGIGASMTSLTVLRAMAVDPIPEKSSQLFTPQIDVWGPVTRGGDSTHDDELLPWLTYRDAMAFMQAHRAARQAAMYAVHLDISPQGSRPFAMHGRAVYEDFFSMFQVPFQAGSPWSAGDEAIRARVAVLGARLAQRLYPQGNAVGSELTLNERNYRIVGVLQAWNPTPQFYDMTRGAYGEPEQLFIPFTTAIDRQLSPEGGIRCESPPPSDWIAQLNSQCVFIEFWVELPTAAAVRDYRRFLYSYADQQRQMGRFHWPALVQLPNVTKWLVWQHAVSDEARVNALVACGFLLVCLINVVALILAKFTRRRSEFGVRRAMGATKSDIFLQCLVETGVVGAAGGLLGLILTALGLAADRAFVAGDLGRLAHLDEGVVTLALLVAVLATVCSGLYPTWRASQVQPGLQLKAP
ncbi:MAG TPA: ABC transporter permease [Steroidobacteraceae bacterium]|nr:ABC transporter permease [Steroidobacteraceae bacterium]